MLAKRLPLLSAFAGGCLFTAALVGFLREDRKSPEPSPKPRAGLPSEPASAHAAEASPHVPPSEAAPAAAPKVAEHAAQAEPLRGVEASAEPPANPGSSVAEVLARLEAAYREGLAGSATKATTEATVPASAPVAAAAPATAVVAEPSVVAPAPAAPPVPVAPLPAVALVAPAPAAAPVPAPRVASEPVAALLASAAPNVVHIGDVNQTVYNGPVREGDQYQVQQLALLQYLQLYSVPPVVGVAPPATNAQRPLTRRARSDPFATMNPDNPWGFDFPPTVLVK